MLTKRIIACLDVKDGRVVKGVQFVDLIDAGDPAELAARHAEAGADEIVLLDITATHEARGTLLDTVRRTAKRLFIPFTVGGGVRTLDDARSGRSQQLLELPKREHNRLLLTRKRFEITVERHVFAWRCHSALAHA